MKRILGTGNALVDVLVQVSDEYVLQEMGLPKGAMTLLSKEAFEQTRTRLSAMHTTLATGGSACNTMLALGKLGAQPGLIGSIGNDTYGDFFSQNCRQHGIIPHLLRQICPTGVASTFITPDGERTFGTFLGAASKLAPEAVCADWFTGYDYLYLEGYLIPNRPLMEHLLTLAHQHKMTICLDLASFNLVEAERDYLERLLSDHVDIVFANKEEALAFCGSDTLRTALEELAARCDIAVVKTGEDGAMARMGDTVVHQPAHPVRAVTDTTGAGDYFAAGFLWGHACGNSIAECLRKGTMLAAHVIEEVGTTLPAGTWKIIQEQLKPTS